MIITVQLNDAGRTYAAEVADHVATYGGCLIFDYALRSSEDTDAAVVELALDCGWAPVDADELRALVAGQCPSNIDEDAYGEGRAEQLGWARDDAEDFLQLIAPEGYWAGGDGDAGAFGVWLIDEETGETILP